ncbi:hypothetical protein AA105894_1871 [Asaia spathodeae NBRC 105894]|nr:hypothetical protein AA105894_1871 [Asaia spathodeae NBRC 105894]
MGADHLYLVEMDRLIHRPGMGNAHHGRKESQGQGRAKAHRQILKAGPEIGPGSRDKDMALRGLEDAKGRVMKSSSGL